MTTVPRLRRAFTLHAYWTDGDLVFENFVARVAVSADPIAIRILTFFTEWRPRSALAAEFPDFTPSSVARAVQQLIEHTLLVEEGSEAARLSEAVATTWRDWLPHAGMHFATKDTPFARPRRWARMARALRRADPHPPPLFKRYPHLPARDLPPPDRPEDEFLRVLLARKTHREFSRKPVALDTLASLLRYTWGAFGTINGDLGPVLHKTSPSGGARHPGEVYVAALNVKGLARGLYHYNARDHTLECIRRGPMRRQVLSYAVGQRHLGQASAVCFMTALFPRTMYKYRAPRAYRVVTLETGHLAQTFCLVATWLGLAPFTTAAVVDTAIERALGIDGVTESIMYVAGVGMPLDVSAVRPAASSRRRASALRKRPTR